MAEDSQDRDRQAAGPAECIVLSERDMKRVLELLKNPSKPTPALLAAAGRIALRESARK